MLAGAYGTFGGVGYPDLRELDTPAAHCDAADWVDTPHYGNSQEQARAQLVRCVRWLRTRFEEAIKAGGDLVDDQNQIIADELPKRYFCVGTFGALDPTAKCKAIVGFGRALHGVQDFYSHSNWTDVASPPYSATNPPGLGLVGPARPLFLLSAKGTIAASPTGLTTGCWVVLDSTPGVLGCTNRVTHHTLNKDKGKVDPETGAASDPRTPRGKAPGSTGANFRAAVAGAIAETTQQWADMRAALPERYGQERADLIACALTHDDPLTTCKPTHLLYRAVIKAEKSCSGRCHDGSPEAQHFQQEKYTFTVVGDVTLADLPNDPDDPPTTAEGKISQSAFPDAVNNGYATDEHTRSLHAFCYGVDGHSASAFLRIDTGPLAVTSLSAQGPENGPPVSYVLTWAPGDGGPTSVRDVWHDVFTASHFPDSPIDDPDCQPGTQEYIQSHGQVVLGINALHYELDQFLPGERRIKIELPRNEPVEDRVLASLHQTATFTYGANPDVETYTVEEDFQLVTDATCDGSGLPPEPLINCSGSHGTGGPTS